MICGPWGHYIQVNLNKNRKTFYCFFAIHGIASVKRSCLPFGNTFGLFCFPRVQDALSGSVYPTYRLPRVLLGTPMGDIILLLRFRKAIRHPHGDLLRTLGKHIRLFSFSESVRLLFWVTPTLIFCRPRTSGWEACYYSLILVAMHFRLSHSNDAAWMDLLWIASLKLIIFTDIRTIKGLKTKMSGFDIFNQKKCVYWSGKCLLWRYVDNIYPLIWQGFRED